MTPDQMCYWLNGFFEMTNAEELTKEQVQMIKEHLSLVFKKDVVVPKESWVGILKEHKDYTCRPQESSTSVVSTTTGPFKLC